MTSPALPAEPLCRAGVSVLWQRDHRLRSAGHLLGTGTRGAGHGCSISPMARALAGDRGSSAPPPTSAQQLHKGNGESGARA